MVGNGGSSGRNRLRRYSLFHAKAGKRVMWMDSFAASAPVIDETLGRNGNGIRSLPRWNTNPPTTTSAPMSCAIWTVSEMKSGSTQSSASMKATNSPCATLSAAFRAGPRLR